MIPLANRITWRVSAVSPLAAKFDFGKQPKSLRLLSEASVARSAARASLEDRYPNPTSGRAAAAGAPFLVNGKAPRVSVRHARATAGLTHRKRPRLALSAKRVLAAPDLKKNSGFSCLYELFFLRHVRPQRSQGVTCLAMRNVRPSERRPAPWARQLSMEICWPEPRWARQQAHFATTQASVEDLNAEHNAHQDRKLKMAIGTTHPGGHCFTACATPGAGRD